MIKNKTKSISVSVSMGGAILWGLTVVSGQTLAAGAVTIQDFDGATNTLNPGSSLVASGFTGVASSFTDNPALNFSSWAHQGHWWNFELTGTSDVSIRVDARNSSEFSPAVSLWTAGSTVFDGGTTSFAGETSSAGFGTPHSFNSTGAQGDAGTLWMQNGQGGNMLETLGYANSGATHHPHEPTGWGEHLENGAHDVSLTNNFESGIGGSVGAGYAELMLADMVTGWYTIYVGGGDHAQIGGLYDVSISANVSAVPVPAAAWLFASGLLGLIGVARKKRNIR